MEENKYTKIISDMSEWGNIISSLIFFQREICSMNNWSYSEIWQLAQSKKFMVWAGYWSNNDSLFEKFSKYSSYFKFANGIGIIGKAWQEKRPVVFEDLVNERTYLRSEILIKSGLNSSISIPIILEGKVTNVICIYFNKITDKDKKECESIYNSLKEISLNKNLIDPDKADLTNLK